LGFQLNCFAWMWYFARFHYLFEVLYGCGVQHLCFECCPVCWRDDAADKFSTNLYDTLLLITIPLRAPDLMAWLGE